MAEKSTVTSGANATGLRLVLFHRPTRRGGVPSLVGGLSIVCVAGISLASHVLQVVGLVM